MSVNSGTEIITDNLLLYVDAGNTRSYPGTGNTWFDISGNARHGNLSNTPTFVSALTTTTDGNFYFDTASNQSCQFVDTIYPATWDDTSTIEMWIYVAAAVTWNTSATYNENMFSRGTFAGYHGIGRTVTNNVIYFLYRGDVASVSISTALPARDKWTQIVSVWNGTSIKAYVNGALKIISGSSNATTMGGTPEGATTWSLAGARALTGSTGSSTTMNASIVRVYSRELTATEIHCNFNATRSRFGL